MSLNRYNKNAALLAETILLKVPRLFVAIFPAYTIG